MAKKTMKKNWKRSVNKRLVYSDKMLQSSKMERPCTTPNCLGYFQTNYGMYGPYLKCNTCHAKPSYWNNKKAEKVEALLDK